MGSVEVATVSEEALEAATSTPTPDSSDEPFKLLPTETERLPLAHHHLKGSSPGLMFLPGFMSNMTSGKVSVSFVVWYKRAACYVNALCCMFLLCGYLGNWILSGSSILMGKVSWHRNLERIALFKRRSSMVPETQLATCDSLRSQEYFGCSFVSKLCLSFLILECLAYVCQLSRGSDFEVQAII
jgi:hypothetical protein